MEGKTSLKELLREFDITSKDNKKDIYCSDPKSLEARARFERPPYYLLYKSGV